MWGFFRIIKKIFINPAREAYRPPIVVHNEKYDLIEQDIRDFFKTSYTLSALYNAVFRVASTLDIIIYKNNVKDDVLSFNGTSWWSELVADYLFFGKVIFDSLLNKSENENDIVLINKNCVSYSARKLFEKIIHLERADKQLAERLGADVFLVPSDPTKPLVDTELAELREILLKKRQLGGAGGIEPLAYTLDFKEAPVDYEKYKLDESFRRSIRSLCNLYGVPIEILDNETSTYNNKKLAQIALYQDFIIPLSYSILSKIFVELNKFSIKNGNDVAVYKAEVVADVPVLKEIQKENDMFILELYKSGVLSLDEVKETFAKYVV